MALVGIVMGSDSDMAIFLCYFVQLRIAKVKRIHSHGNTSTLEGTAREYRILCGAGFILLMTQIDAIIVVYRTTYITIDGKITAVGY